VTWRVIQGDCLEAMRAMDAASVDAIVTDPPAGIGFMGKGWDHDRGGAEQWIAWLSEVMREAIRVAKPGAHALVWALPRTSHWTGTALERAGWEVRDQLHHVFGSGFPKSLDVSKAIDAAAGAERPIVGQRSNGCAPSAGNATSISEARTRIFPATAPATAWSGWGTALKPAHEVWWLARKPLVGTVAANVLEYGTGGINVEGCRVGYGGKDLDEVRRDAGSPGKNGTTRGVVYGEGLDQRDSLIDFNPSGRWPPNLLLSHDPSCNGVCAPTCPVAEMDRQSGDCASRDGAANGGFRDDDVPVAGFLRGSRGTLPPGRGDSGGASRFFPVFRYVAKPSRGERDAGCWDLEDVSGNDVTGRKDGSAGAVCSARAGPTSAARRNIHPTVKPVELMEWLVRLVTPPGGTVLDPFTGSGSTGCAAVRLGSNFIGIEREPEYARIAERRIRLAANAPKAKPLGALERGPAPVDGQLSLLGPEGGQ
jgi:site-specific DNA-methyltransferase (adenine-specific)